MHDDTATNQRPLPPRRAGSRQNSSLPITRAEPLLSVRDVARMLFVSRPTVYSMIRRGELRAIYVRRLVRLRPSAVASYARLHQKRIAAQRARARRRQASRR